MIPVSAFHEWGPSAGGRKQAHEFSDPDDDWLWIAGLWEPGGDHMRWKLPDPDAMTA